MNPGHALRLVDELLAEAGWTKDGDLFIAPPEHQELIRKFGGTDRTARAVAVMTVIVEAESDAEFQSTLKEKVGKLMLQ